MQKIYHNIPNSTVLKIMGTDRVLGLATNEVKKRQSVFGENSLAKNGKNTKIKMVLNQFKSPLIYILLFAGIVTLFLSQFTDAIVIFLAVILNTVFGFLEEKKVSNVLQKLENTIKTKTYVLRNGKKKQILQKDVVLGDIIFLEAGQKVPADARLISVNNLKISEAVLTGEWMSEDKEIEVLPKDTPLADRKNMVFMGSLVENGEGMAVVTATGKKTETGKIAQLLSETEEVKTPLQEKLYGFSKKIGVVIGVICVLIFILGITLRGLDWAEMFETSVAITVGGIPEALPVVMTIILAIGTERILRKKGLIRKLSSVETLGSTQIICFDKTKTLTQGKMKLHNIITSSPDLALKIGILCNDAFIENPEEEKRDNWIIKGSSTSKAILESAINNGMDIVNIRKNNEELQNVPFNSKNKYLLSLRKEGKKRKLYICGAPEKVLERSKNAQKWQEEINKLSDQGFRVVAVGYKEIKRTSQDLNNIANNFNFVGLIAFSDPLRDDVKESIERCKEAGIITILATGDHVLTAKHIANQIGMDITEENIIDGEALNKLSDAELEKRLGKIKVFARVEPKDKLRIVNLWQKKGKVIAMTGDGVNDAPAIKKADIGIALGSGTDVAIESSDLVLMDDSFSTIVKTIEEGRVILDNLRKSISYVLADSFSSAILISFSTIIFGWPLPILPVQILWNNLIEDSLPMISFAFEPKEKNIMQRRPIPKKSPLLTKEMKTLIFATGTIDQFFILIVFWFLYIFKGLDIEYVRTLMFGCICIDTAFVIFAYKNLRKNIWQFNPFSNMWLNVSAIIVFISFAAAIYLPVFQTLLKTVPLGLGSWCIVISTALLSLIAIELTKHFFIARHQTEK